uniref:Uncharacterized protein n=1 Tax=Florenciella sp. virus SA2 TaxID=3240092 RepID=A0AB39J6F0_9VIRU
MCSYYFWYCLPFCKKNCQDAVTTQTSEKYKTVYKEGKYYVFLTDGSCGFIEI